jgi:hypothetical protein
MERDINKDLDKLESTSNRILIYVLIIAVTTLWAMVMFQDHKSDDRRNHNEKECEVVKEKYERKIDSLLVVLSDVKDKNLQMLLGEKERYDSSISTTRQEIKKVEHEK